jgi:hypothetical protein
MSHRATNWAIEQRGLKPATKIVLWHLADRHNPDFGCFPSQLDLARDCEMASSTLNEHLRILEQKGLIRRIRRYDPETRQHRSTRYILCFEAEFTQGPSPESGVGDPAEPTPDFAESRLRNPESNPVREPVSTTTAPERGAPDPAVARCLEAAGPGLCEAARTAIRGTDGVVRDWIGRGFDLELDAVPAIRMRTAAASGKTIRTWAYFTPLIVRLHAKRTARAEPEQAMKTSSEAENARPAARPTAAADPVLAAYAAWIKARTVPPSAVNNVLRDRLLAAGLVTRADLRACQIY